MNNQDIFNLIESNHKHTVELMNATRTAINAETKASADKLESRMISIEAKQDITNGRVSALETECHKNERFRLAMRYKIIGIIAVSVILAVIVHQFGLLEAIGIIK